MATAAPLTVPVAVKVVPHRADSAERILRTCYQVLAAAVPAVPAFVGVLGLSAATASMVVGIFGLIVIVVVAVQNIAETVGILPATLRNLPAIAPTAEETAAAGKVAPAVAADVAKAEAAAPLVAAVEESAKAPPA